MSAILIILTLVAPLLLAAGLLLPGRAGRWLLCLAPLAPLPALLLAVWPGEARLDASWFVLGTHWALDDLGRRFLLFTAGLWLASGLFAAAYPPLHESRRRFFLFFLLAMTGNLGLILAGEMLGFLAFFALMSFASYGLVVHQGRPEDCRAGRVYIALVIVGELLLFTATVMVGSLARGTDFGSLRQVLATVPAAPGLLLLFVAGFGIKLGIVPLHVWLPLAHPAAPTPASAVLSGAMIKAGLLGLLRVLPLGETTLPNGGTILAVFGLVAALGAALYGATQRHPKTILAYSSVSQMGLVTVCLGLGLAAPAAWPMLLAAILALVTHHALAKGALFLGVGVADADWSDPRQRRWIGLLLSVTGLALAGLPLTGGAVAKIALKAAAADSVVPLADLLGWLLPLTGLTTSLIVLRYLFAVWPRPGHSHFAPRPLLWTPWLALIAGVLTLPWLGPDLYWATPANLAKSSWPILLMLGLAWGLTRRPAWQTRLQACFPPAGDFLTAFDIAWRGFQAAWQAVVTGGSTVTYQVVATLCERGWNQLGHGAYRAAHLIERWEVVATVLPLLIGLLWWLST